MWGGGWVELEGGGGGGGGQSSCYDSYIHSASLTPRFTLTKKLLSRSLSLTTSPQSPRYFVLNTSYRLALTRAVVELVK